MMRSACLFTVVTLSCCFARLLPAAEAEGVSANATVLAKYVAIDDGEYSWKSRRTGQIGKTEYAELTLSSQKWQGIVWKHQLFIIKPSSADPKNSHALLMIAGGRWRDKYAEADGDDKLPSEARLFANIAESFRTPVAVLLQVPHQPLFDGKYEDAIIALTFDKFLETGDPHWPLLMPMVKSAVRGMDAIQQYAKKQWSQEIKTFTVTGASKRGWTTWLTGAVDPRAIALAPMVIDMLNMGEHIRLQKQAWGTTSSSINDYTERGLHEKLSTKAGRELISLVDPFAYRRLLQQPKLLLIGTNDNYWPLDSLNLYWNELPGDKYIVYVPNNGHGLSDLSRVVGSVNALHQHAAGGDKLPKLEWKFRESNRQVSVQLTSDVGPHRVRAWVANSMTRDFRQANWASRVVKQRDGSYSFQLDVPEVGYTAMFAEAEFAREDLPFYLSTNVRIVGTQATQAAE